MDPILLLFLNDVYFWLRGRIWNGNVFCTRRIWKQHDFESLTFLHITSLPDDFEPVLFLNHWRFECHWRIWIADDFDSMTFIVFMYIIEWWTKLIQLRFFTLIVIMTFLNGIRFWISHIFYMYDVFESDLFLNTWYILNVVCFWIMGVFEKFRIVGRIWIRRVFEYLIYFKCLPFLNHGCFWNFRIIVSHGRIWIHDIFELSLTTCLSWPV